MSSLMKIFFCGMAVLVASCDDAPSNSTPPTMDPVPPMVPDVAYYGSAGSIDSAGKVVPARLLFLMRADSSFKLYLSPASLPLYHPRSQFDLIRIRGRLQSSGIGQMLFSVDSSLSYRNDGRPIRSGSVMISSDPFYPNVRYVEIKSRAISGGIGKMEYGVGRSDSNKVAQQDLGL